MRMWLVKVLPFKMYWCFPLELLIPLKLNYLFSVEYKLTSAVQFSSVVQSLSRVQLFATPWTATHQASLSITNSQSPPKPMSIESVMPSNHLILCRPLLLLPSIIPSIRVFSNESALCIMLLFYLRGSWYLYSVSSLSKLSCLKFVLLYSFLIMFIIVFI